MQLHLVSAFKALSKLYQLSKLRARRGSDTFERAKVSLRHIGCHPGSPPKLVEVCLLASFDLAHLVVHLFWLCRKCVCLGPGGARHFRTKTRKRATKRENAKTRKRENAKNAKTRKRENANTRKRENAHGSTRARKLDSYDHLRI